MTPTDMQELLTAALSLDSHRYNRDRQRKRDARSSGWVATSWQNLPFACDLLPLPLMMVGGGRGEGFR